MEDAGAAAREPAGLGDRGPPDLGELRLVAKAERLAELAPERPEVLAAERVLGHDADGEGPDPAGLLGHEAPEPVRPGPLVEEGEEPPAEQVPHVPERPVEREVRDHVEGEEP